MISKDEIKKSLTKIAENNNLVGESIDLIVDELTYFLYNGQLDIVNAIQEVNLSTAALLNSKIRNCMNVMYPVYRGRNARVNLNFRSNTYLKYSKFDKIFQANTFNVYAESATEYGQSITDGSGNISSYNLIGILAPKMYDTVIDINTTNKYYVDAQIDREILSNLSEDIQVFIDGKEYNTTRNFYDYIQNQVPIKDYDYYVIDNTYWYALNNEWNQIPDAYNDSISMSKEEYNALVDKLYKLGELSSTSLLPQNLSNQLLDEIFILTIPDYGIRLYKRNYFFSCQEVRIKAFPYTTIDDINSDEFNKIVIPGTVLYNGENTATMNYDNVVRRGVNSNGIIKEIDRDDSNSLLQQANLYQHMQSTILSNSDINALFNETFIDQVRSSINWHTKINEDDNAGVLCIFYVPKTADDELTQTQVNKFKRDYSSHYVTSNIVAISGVRCRIECHLSLVITDNIELNAEISRILNNYALQLNNPANFIDSNPLKPNILNIAKIKAEISRIDAISYIDDIYFEYVDEIYKIDDKVQRMHTDDGEGTTTQKLPITYIKQFVKIGDNELEIKVPTYYEFVLNISYTNQYEAIS